MRFSIIIPAYNAENHIRKALESIKSQTFKDYELIVVCDSCTDNTSCIAKEYTNNVYEVEYGCDGPTRNTGIDVAKGDYILFMDDDDWWLHEFVLSQINDKLNEQNCDLLCFSFIWKGVKYASPLSNNGWPYPAVWNKCWKRSFIGNTRFPAIKSISDWYFHCDCFARNPKIIYWDMPMYYYNFLREGSISWEEAQHG